MSPSAPSTIKRALLSVSNKEGLVDFARVLAEKDVELVSTGGTARVLREAGLAVRDVSELTDFPEMMDGRVKTLHPKIHGGLLGRRDLESHVQAMRDHDIAAIDLVVVNLYPFVETAAKPDATDEELIENIDIGGPSMLRSAAKNHAAVTVVCDPADYEGVGESIAADGNVPDSERRRLALKAFSHTAAYDVAIARTLTARFDESNFGQTWGAVGDRVEVLRYGENPHQKAALYTFDDEGIALATADPLQGKRLSYNNLLDADAAVFSLRCLVEGGSEGKHGAVVIKHGTPCGAAWADNQVDAWARALSGDPKSAFGGIVAFNHPVEGHTAQAMREVFLEVVVAPAFTDEAREVFASKKNLRLLPVENLITAPCPAVQVRSVAGGLLVQDHDQPTADTGHWEVVTKRPPTQEERAGLELAFRLCAAVRSNAITLAGPHTLFASGGGQTSRVDAVELAIKKARMHGHELQGATLGSDAFFPFPDGVVVAAEAGITAVAQPGGSKRDAAVIAACDEHDLAMVFTGRRHFRH
jgi:phosphoribosylaminoimidazolecarboxamide formyltransferase/IMP cyclohydrolase